MGSYLKKIYAYEYPTGLGFAYLEPIPSFHPPSLPKIKELKPTKLMKKLLKQDEERVNQFRNRLLIKQPKPVFPMMDRAAFDPSPLNLPPLFHASAKRRKKR